MKNLEFKLKSGEIEQLKVISLPENGKLIISMVSHFTDGGFIGSSEFYINGYNDEEKVVWAKDLLHDKFYLKLSSSN